MPSADLEQKAPENGTFGIQCDFVEKTPAGNIPFTPNLGLKWSLTDSKGQVINNRTEVPITPDQSVIIVLSGLDLALAGGPAIRYVLVEGTYDGTLGNDLPVIKEVSFQIKNFVGKP